MKGNISTSRGGGITQALPRLLEKSLSTREYANMALSFALSHSATEGEIIQAAKIIGTTAKELRPISEPFTHRKEEFVREEAHV